VSIKNLSAVTLLFLAAFSAHAASAAAGPGRFYCCEGRRYCGDSLPAQCRGKAYRILDSGGNLVKEVGPPQTAEQKAQALLEEKRRKELEEQAKEQRRKDSALLETYANVQDIDMSQQKAEADVTFVIKAAALKIEEASRQRKKFENEVEFYKNKPLPPDVARGLRETEHEIKTQEDLLTMKRAEFDAIKAKYDGDRKRYLELTGKGKPPVDAGKAGTPPASSPAR
jgi:predicted DNA-binding WGR domain protein